MYLTARGGDRVRSVCSRLLNLIVWLAGGKPARGTGPDRPQLQESTLIPCKLQGENGKIIYQIVHGDPQDQFQIEEQSGQIGLAKLLDREMISSYGKQSETRRPAGWIGERFSSVFCGGK